MTVQDMILIAAMLGVMVLGFFVIRHLDKFLGESRKRIEQEEKKKDPVCTMLTAELSDEELIQRIRTYEEKHGKAKIALYQDEDALYDELFGDKR